MDVQQVTYTIVVMLISVQSLIQLPMKDVVDSDSDVMSAIIAESLRDQ